MIWRLLFVVVLALGGIALPASAQGLYPESLLLGLDDLPSGFTMQPPTTNDQDILTSSQAIFLRDQGNTRTVIINVVAVMTDGSGSVPRFAMEAFGDALIASASGQRSSGPTVGDDSLWYTGTVSGAPMTMVAFRAAGAMGVVGMAINPGRVNQGDVQRLAEVLADRIHTGGRVVDDEAPSIFD